MPRDIGKASLFTLTFARIQSIVSNTQHICRGSGNWTDRIVPTLLVVEVVFLLLSLLLGGFIVYQWVLASQATATSLVLIAFWLRYYPFDRRKSKWPPLLPLAVMGASGAAKSFYVATGQDTRLLVMVILLAAVLWFISSSWRVLRAVPTR